MGLYAPIIKGEIEGLKIGLQTDLILWEHARKLAYDQFEGEWLIGYGVGFNKGQDIRKKIIKNIDETLLNKRINTVLLLLKRIPYSQFEAVLFTNLENLKNWESKHLTEEIITEVASLIKQTKLQRALKRIEAFYQDQKVLTAWMDYSLLSKRLGKLRQRKQCKEINNEGYLSKKQEIEEDLKKWIETNKIQIHDPA